MIEFSTMERPDIETSLRDPLNEANYRREYNNMLKERAMTVIEPVLGKEEESKKEILEAILGGASGSTEVKAEVTKALSEAGLLRIWTIEAAVQEISSGWAEKAELGKGFSNKYGIVSEYWVELPKEEVKSPVTTKLKLSAGKIERSLDRDYTRWILTRSTM